MFDSGFGRKKDKEMKNNKLIAKFMGLNQAKLGRFNNLDGRMVYVEGTIPSYHSDWNKLMQVVEKIENTRWGNQENEEGLYTWTETPFMLRIQGYDIGIVLDGIDKNSKVFDSKKYSFYNTGLCSTKIEGVYNACVAFIKWYNEQNK